ncbi:PEP-CTERM sorting domain-containing protein [Massilia sp. Root418]|uniref:PEP-CTERM sorting domain-containing protein n=1 Tax=Massilia sp. Root418 TaxID=1736532 RepID=UPI001910B01E|nr:PEP-CTERM sorting domain-containing protein [Massilia sp. Root418]
MTQARADSARAEISGFTIELIDLDLADGVSPGFAIVSQSQHAYYSLVRDGIIDSDEIYGHGSVGRNDAGAVLSSSVSGDALASTVNATVGGTSFLASSDWSARFHLSPATAVIFRAMTRVDAVLGLGGEALSQAGMSGDLEDLGVPGSSGGFYSWLVGNAGAPPAANDGILYGELRSGSEGANGYLSLYTSARVVTSPVPEPGSWAMLLAGLGVAAGLALRSRGRGIGRRPRPRPARGLASGLGRGLAPSLRRGLAPGLAAMLALAAGGAAAQSSASVSMGTWRYTLTDLAPLDGIAPRITLAPQSSSPAYRSIAWHGRPMEEGQDWQGETSDTGAPLYWERDGNTASSWSLPSGIETAVHSVGTPVLAYGMREFSFTLTPFTQVSFFQDGHQASSGTVGVPGARARLAVTLNNYPAGAAGWDESELVGDGERDFTLFAAAASQGESAAGTVNLQATSYVLVAVPEPAQYAMWLAGMGLLFAYRRRWPRA